MDDLLPDLADVVVEPTALLDIVLTAVLIYGVLSLIQGTRAVRLVIGAIILFVVYVVAQELDLRLLSAILQAGAVVGLVALVVVFQPELRRGLDRLGRVGSWGWLGPSDVTSYQRTAGILAASAARLSRRRAGALIVIERDTGLGDMAETGIAIDAELSTELLTTIFATGYPLHDGAVIVRGQRIAAAGVMLPLAERDASLEAYGTRHRAALGHHRADRRPRHRGQRGARRHQPGGGWVDRARPRRARAATAALRAPRAEPSAGPATAPPMPHGPLRTPRSKASASGGASEPG